MPYDATIGHQNHMEMEIGFKWGAICADIPLVAAD
jgi:hypothetical protein